MARAAPSKRIRSPRCPQNISEMGPMIIWHTWVTHWKYMNTTDLAALIARFMRPTWGPPGADRTQVGPMLAPWILLSGSLRLTQNGKHHADNIFDCIMEMVVFLIKFHRNLFPVNGPFKNKRAFFSDNGLAPNWWQTIIGTNDSLVDQHMHHVVSMCIRYLDHHMRRNYIVLGPEGLISEISLTWRDKGRPCFSVSWMSVGHGNPVVEFQKFSYITFQLYHFSRVGPWGGKITQYFHQIMFASY